VQVLIEHSLFLVPMQTIQVDAFIPQQWVQAPLGPYPWSLSDRTFAGDSRKNPLDGSFTTGTAIFNTSGSYRLEQKLDVTHFKFADPNGSQENATATVNVGLTKLYANTAIVGVLLSPTAQPVETKFATPTVGPPNVTHSTDSIVTAEITCTASDPLAYGSSQGPITYDITVTIDYTDPSHPTYTLSGSHALFPAYEVYVGNQLIHDYSPIPEGFIPNVLLDGAFPLNGSDIGSGITKPLSGNLNP